MKPYESKYSEAKGRWDAIAENLKQSYPEFFAPSFDGKAAQVKITHLLASHKKFNAESKKASGRKLGGSSTHHITTSQ